MTSIEEGLEDRANEFLEAARLSLDSGHLNVSFEESRTAAELAAKLRLFRASGERPKDHNPAGRLQELKILPAGVSAKDLSLLLGQFSRGAYGFSEFLSEVEARAALKIASKMVASL